MDLINKGIAWARNICETLEAMCLEVDDIMFKQHAGQANGSEDDMLPPTSDEVAGCESFRKAGEANGSRDDMSPPTSDEVAGCKSFGKAEESSNLVNSIAHPSSALPSSCFDTCGKSIECEDNPAASASVSKIELSHDGSVSIPETGKSDDKRCTSVAEPSKATIQASDYKKLADFLYLVSESNERYPAFCKAANRRYSKKQKQNKSRAPETRSVIEEDKKLQAGDEAAGSNHQNDHDSWESEWLIV